MGSSFCFLKFAFGAEKVHFFGHKADFTSHLGVTFLALYTLTTQTLVHKKKLASKLLETREFSTSMCMHAIFLPTILRVANCTFRRTISSYFLSVFTQILPQHLNFWYCFEIFYVAQIKKLHCMQRKL